MAADNKFKEDIITQMSENTHRVMMCVIGLLGLSMIINLLLAAILLIPTKSENSATFIKTEKAELHQALKNSKVE